MKEKKYKSWNAVPKKVRARVLSQMRQELSDLKFTADQDPLPCDDENDKRWFRETAKTINAFEAALQHLKGKS